APNDAGGADGRDAPGLAAAEGLDRLRPPERERLDLRLLHDHVLALRDLPPLRELVRLDLALVMRAPALLLDRRAALAMERAEGDVVPLGRQGEPDRDVDEAEADRSVPDGAHRTDRILVANSHSYLELRW